MIVIKKVLERGRLFYLVRKGRRVTWLVVRHLGNDDLCLHWISVICGAQEAPERALRFALKIRRPRKRARPGRAEVTVAQINNGELRPADFSVGAYAVLRGGFSNHELTPLCGGCNQPEPDWAFEPEPLWPEADDDEIGQWRSTGVFDAPNGSGGYVILPARSSSWP